MAVGACRRTFRLRRHGWRRGRCGWLMGRMRCIAIRLRSWSWLVIRIRRFKSALVGSESFRLRRALNTRLISVSFSGSLEVIIKSLLAAGAAALLCVSVGQAAASATSSAATEAQFRDLYKELVETN